jgi:ubiquinone/menaquinone biosynthesis C-methylase UbiE
MSNDELYAGGLLNRALDPATQPPQIRAFLQAEMALLSDVIVDGMAMVDVGCGTGRHLAMLRDRLRIGVGVDYDHGYIVEAHRTARAARLHFVTGDATRLPLRRSFDIATCLTNTWGTMSDKLAVLDEMRRLAPMRLVSVYAEASIPARREWYRKLGQNVVDESDECLVTEGGFRSEHFSEARLRTLVGNCTIRPFADMAYLVLF